MTSMGRGYRIISAKNSHLLTEITGEGFEIKKLKKEILNGVKQLNRQLLFLI